MPLRVEIETTHQFAAAVAASDLTRAVVQSLDLTGREADLAAVPVAGAIFLGCLLSDDAADSARDRGALIFPWIPDVPLDAYRAHLYTARELFDTLTYGDYDGSLDARAYAWTRAAGAPPSIEHTLVASLHDHAISDALEEYLESADDRRVVGIMGGHAMERGSVGYASTARLAMSLASRGYLVASGGGPGAMEAANLGARLSPHGAEALSEAVASLALVPSFRPSVDAWARSAFAVLDRYEGGADTLGIPTWFYGHEPPNVFATRIAKYCSNALREDTLLQRCQGGLVYLPGAAGTVQELFQAVTGNYYAADPAMLTPLVLVGVEQWTQKLPVWPLLQAAAEGRPMADAIALVDTVDEAGDWLAGRLPPLP